MTLLSAREASIEVNGAKLTPDVSGALYWPSRRTLIVADLHLEKGSSYAQRGRFLPPYDTQATLRALKHAVGRFQPETVICLGDSFHDGAAAERLAPEPEGELLNLIGGRRWVWICGNHDPNPPAHWGGEITEDLVEGPLVFRHEAQPSGAVAGEVSGHFHPKARIATRGRNISARCFVGDGARLILPSFGAYTGGLSVLDPAISGLFPKAYFVWMLGRDQVHRFPKAALS